MIGWILAGLAAATVYTAVKENESYGVASQSNNDASIKLCVIQCPRCGQKLRVPSNKRIEVTCNKCKNVFICKFGTVDNIVAWIAKEIQLRENPPEFNVRTHISDNFYISSYMCPQCRNNMYKTVFRVGGEEYISVNGSKHMLKRLFTCPYCLSFYAPREGRKLSDGSVYFLKCEYSEDYLSNLSYYNSVGTTQGRPDA